MLLELPNMAASQQVHAQGWRHRVISKTFRRFSDMSARQVFTGPPENTRDHVIAASKKLMAGQWEEASKMILELKVWALMPKDQGTGVKDMLHEQIRLCALRTYMLKYSQHYSSMSLPQLCEMFGLAKNKVHSTISKMLINKEMIASWDQPTETVVFDTDVPSALQSMALQFSEKVRSFAPSLPRALACLRAPPLAQ